MKREIKVIMPKDGYISWFVTTQNALMTRVELRDEKGNVCFSEQKKNEFDTSIDPPLAQGAGFIVGSNLSLTVEVETTSELKGRPVLYDITDDNGNIVGKNFTIALEDYSDNDFNDIYVNIVGWYKKG